MAIQLPYPYPDLATGTWDAAALLRNLQFLAEKITAIQTGQLMPTGAIIFLKSGSTCPSGFTKLTGTALSKYIRIDTTAGTTGAASAPSSTQVVQSGTGVTVSSSTHTQSPAFYGMLACEKN